MNTKDQILDVAERLIKRSGYMGFSYAEIAEQVGIRKASIHYHFPSKEDLVVASVQRYTLETQLALAKYEEVWGEPQGVIEAMGEVFIRGFEGEGSGCLCGSLSVEWSTLPPQVQQEVRGYWDGATMWLSLKLQQTTKVAPEEADRVAVGVFSLLEGAMATARVYEDVEPLLGAIEMAKGMVS